MGVNLVPRDLGVLNRDINNRALKTSLRLGEHEHCQIHLHPPLQLQVIKVHQEYLHYWLTGEKISPAKNNSRVADSKK